MERQWGSGRESKIAAKVSLLASGNDGMVQTALISPMVASIMLEFPGKEQLWYDQVISITALMMVPAMFLSSFLARRYNKKWIIILGTMMFAIAGLACSLAPSLEYLVVVRGILGFGAGLCFPLIPSAVAQLFDDYEKNQMLGWINATGSVFSFVLSTAAGFIATFYWKSSFYLYLIFIPILIIQFICLPNFEPEAAPEKEDGDQKATEAFGWKPWFVALGMLVVMGMMTLIMYRLSPIIELNGLGTSADSGLGTSVMTATSFLAALLFGTYFARLKKFSPVVSLALAGSSFLLYGFASSLPVIYVASAMYGLALGSLNPFFMSMMSRVAPASKMTFAMTLTCVCQIGAQVVTPYYMAAVTAIGFTSDFSLCLCTAGLLFAIMVGVLVWAVASRRKEVDRKPQAKTA